MEEEFPSIYILHNKAQSVLGCEGVFQTLQGVMLKLFGQTMENLLLGKDALLTEGPCSLSLCAPLHPS